MPQKRSLRIDLRIWATLAEPRTVTATMIFVYTMIASFSVLSLLHGTLTQGIVIGCVVMLAGGVLGIPAAWRGVWAVEGPAAALCVLGLSDIALVDFLRAIGAGHLPGHTITLTLIVICFFATRMMRVWPLLHRPGTQPMTRRREAEIRADEARRQMEMLEKIDHD